MAEARIGVALLAAGASQRFGEVDKLTVPFRGRALGEHAARSMPRELFERAWLITRSQSSDWSAPGFERIVNEQAQQGMGTSVAMAARLAQEARLDALLIALADMPLVLREHFQALVRAFSGPASILTSAKSQTRLPPALFGSEHFEALSGLAGDKGARDLLMRGEVATCPPEWLIDIDTPDMLQRYGQPPDVAPKPGATGEN